jgi:fibronectin type 3 domain-containing protein
LVTPLLGALPLPGLVLGMVVAGAGCGETDTGPKEVPTLSSFAPNTGPVGASVIIQGTGFSAKGFNVVRFNGATATVVATTPIELTVIVPEDATSGHITVNNGWGTATSADVFTVTGSPDKPPAPPTVTSFAPINGPVGTVVTISGTDFAATPTSNTVTIGGALAPVSAATSTSLTVTVPTSAKTGPISVATLAGTFTTKANFTVTLAPKAPEAVATPVSATQINIIWNLVADATGYNVYRTTTPGVAAIAANRLNADPVPVSPYADTGLTTGTKYYYAVTAINGNGESVGSKEVSATPGSAPTGPPTITGFTPTNGAVGTTVTIAGTNFSSVPADNTVIFGGGVTAAVSAATANSLTVTVPPGAATGVISVTTASGTAKSASPFVVLQPPAAPAGVVAIPVNSTQVNISWNLVAAATGYNVYRSTTQGVAVVAGNRATSAPVTAPPYADTGLTTGTTYYYVVTAVNANGESVASKEVGAMPATPPPAPPVITGFSPTNGAAGALVTINGSYFSAAATNNTVTFGGGVPAVVNSATATTLVVTVPAGATTGKISVTTSAGTTQSAATFTVLQPPPAPTGATANAVGATQITVTWSLSTGATGYNVYRSTTPGVSVSPASKITGSPVTAPPYADSGLTAGSTYYYKVTAVNANGESAGSNEASASLGGALTPPGNVTAVPGVGQVQISWSPVTGATSYNIYYTTGAAIPTASSTKIAGATSPYKHTNLETNVTYNYAVTAKNATSESALSTVVSATPAVPIIVGRLVSGIPQGILQSNVEISVKDNLGAAISNAAVALNNTSLAYDATRSVYKAYVNVAPGEVVTLSVNINGTAYSLPGTTYYYRVQAVNAYGSSDVASFTPIAVMPTTPLPAGPTIPGSTPFTPMSGAIGATVVIQGMSFSAVPLNNTVVFDSGAGGVAVPASVTASTGTTLTVKVPAGAKTGRISVETSAGGPASSGATFEVLAPPDAPTGVVALPNATASTTLDVSWPVVSGATGYSVYRSTTAGVLGTKILTATSTLSIADGGLGASTAYFYVITAVGAYGESSGSREVGAMTTASSSLPTAPPTISSLSSAALAPGATLTIQGTNFSMQALNNTVTFAGGIRGAVVSPMTSSSTMAVVVPDGATPGPGTLTVRTVAGTSDPANFTVDRAPDPPTGIRAIPTGPTQVTVYWKSVPGATGYNVFRSTSSGAAGTQVNTSPLGGNSFPDTGLTRSVTQFTTYPEVTDPSNGPPAPPPWDVPAALSVSWLAGAPFPVAPATYNYGIIIFDTVSINPYWTNALYWNNYISPGTLTASVPGTNIAAGKNVALSVYINTTETVTQGGAVGATSVGSIDIIGAATPVTIITQ